MLLELDNIQGLLDKEYRESPAFARFRLADSQLTEDDVANAEQQLGVTFPDVFRRLVLRFEFAHFRMGASIHFPGRHGDYLSSLIESNKTAWAPAKRPPHRVFIANSDPYAFFLNTLSGEVLTDSVDWRGVVASDFELFFRGVATVDLKKDPEDENVDLAIEVAEAVGVEADNPFWSELAVGHLS